MSLFQQIYPRANNHGIHHMLCGSGILTEMGNESFICICGYHVISFDLQEHILSENHRKYIAECKNCECGQIYHHSKGHKHITTDFHKSWESKKNCDICFEDKRCINFWKCIQCGNEHCYECHWNIQNRKCPFCRFPFIFSSFFPDDTISTTSTIDDDEMIEMLLDEIELIEDRQGDPDLYRRTFH